MGVSSGGAPARLCKKTASACSGGTSGMQCLHAPPFPGAGVNAAVVQADALAVLERLDADVVLSNLPHALTAGVLGALGRKTFKRALVAVHGEDDVGALSGLLGGRYGLEACLMLAETDFTPPQPFRSTVLRVTPRQGRQDPHISAS